MFRSLVAPPDHPAAPQLQAWVRERFRLTAEATVQVRERPCTEPGMPPVETLVSFWLDSVGTDDEPQRHHAKVFKPLADVRPDDLPPWWMKDALRVPPDWACDCC